MKKIVLNEEINKIRFMMGLSPKPIIIESKKTEETSFNFLNKNGIDNPEEIVKQFALGDKSNNQKNIPIMAYLYVVGNRGVNSANINEIIDVVNEYNELAERNRIKPIQITKNGLLIGEKQFNDFLKFTEYIHAVSSTYKTKSSSSVSSDYVTENKPIWSGNNIDIYLGNNVGKCIEYTQGSLTGRKYSFCIGQIGNKMYKSYRDGQESTFYFIVDKNKFKTNDDGSVNLDDPLHIVVFDVTNRGIQLTDANNTTGTIAEYGTNVKEYVNYLKSIDVPVEKLINRPKSEQEKYEDRFLEKQNTSLSWFINLDNPKNPNYRKPDLEPGQSEQNYYKSAYIGRGHELTDEQFDFLFNNKDLIKQYINTGIAIPEYQYNRLNDNFKKTYKRARLKMFEFDSEILPYELEILTPDETYEFALNSAKDQGHRLGSIENYVLEKLSQDQRFEVIMTLVGDYASIVTVENISLLTNEQRFEAIKQMLESGWFYMDFEEDYNNRNIWSYLDLLTPEHKDHILNTLSDSAG